MVFAFISYYGHRFVICLIALPPLYTYIGILTSLGFSESIHLSTTAISPVVAPLALARRSLIIMASLALTCADSINPVRSNDGL
jgi:hypothetical protein